jgi:hypothetical protein
VNLRKKLPRILDRAAHAGVKLALEINAIADFVQTSCAVRRGGGWLGNSSFNFSMNSLVSEEGCV